jgi:hypothetical protein
VQPVRHALSGDYARLEGLNLWPLP